MAEHADLWGLGLSKQTVRIAAQNGDLSPQNFKKKWEKSVDDVVSNLAFKPVG